MRLRRGKLNNEHDRYSIGLQDGLKQDVLTGMGFNPPGLVFQIVRVPSSAYFGEDDFGRVVEINNPQAFNCSSSKKVFGNYAFPDRKLFFSARKGWPISNSVPHVQKFAFVDSTDEDSESARLVDELLNPETIKCFLELE